MGWCQVGILPTDCYRGEANENRGAASHPRIGRHTQVVDGPFMGLDDAVDKGASCLRLVQAVILVFDSETVIGLDVF